MKKGFFAAFLCALVMVLLPAAVYAKDGNFGDADGSSDDPYIIEDAEDLKAFRDKVNSGEADACAKLTANIVLDCDKDNQWTPIGSGSEPYKGTFDGNGKTISGIYINNDGYEQGLFGRIGEGGTVKNLGIEDSWIKGYRYVGGIAGSSHGSITGCYNEGEVSGGNEVGGIAGYSSGSIEGCYNTGEVSGSDSVGGIAGDSIIGRIEGCYNTGEVSGSGIYVGGIVGPGGSIEDCYNTGSVNGGNEVGGIAGYSYGSIEGCYNTGEVSGGNRVGGIAGNSDDSIEGCYNTGSVSGRDYVGGMAGYTRHCSITDCYNTGKVRGSNYVGGIMGNSGGGRIEGCYNTGEVRGSDYVGGIAGFSYGSIEGCYYLEGSAADDSRGTPLTETEFADIEKFTDWKFSGEDAVWKMDVGLARPVLKSNPEKSEYGDGTEDTPYLIYTAGQLASFRNAVNGGDNDACAELMEDIVINKNVLNSDGSLNEEDKDDLTPWTPIGYYTGTFDGKGHTISGIYINNDGYYQGLFGRIGEGGTVKDLGIEDSWIKGGNNVGGIAGYSSGNIEDCYNTGSVRGGYVGGIAGYSGGSITDCYNEGEVSGGYVGGIAGYSGGSIEGCYNEGEVSGSYAGGIAGNSDGGRIKGCYNTGSVSVNEVYDYSGGIVGISEGDRIEDCYNTGGVSGGIAGGIEGYKSGGSIEGCYNTGSVIGYYSGGGIAGHSNGGRIEDCYNTGSVIGYNEGGGIAGYSGGSIEDCYNTGSVSGYDVVGGIAGSASIDNANNKVIKNCYNTGKINDDKGGGIVRYLTAMDGSDLINCYYLEGCGKDNSMGTKKTLEEFASGEVAYLLQSGSDEQVWGQEKDEDFPILTDDKDLRIYKVTFMAEGTEYAAAYGNRDGVRVMPKDPELSGEGFGHWEDEDGDEFTQNSRVKEDMTVTAVEKEKEPEPEKPQKPGSSYSLPEGITKDEEKEPEKEPDTEEKPDDTKTDIPGFDDVSIFDWYYEGVMYVSENGIISGYGSEYGVGEAVTREDFAAILYRYAEYKGYDTTQGGMAVREFADYEEISEYAKTPVAWAVNTGIISGMGNGSVSPKTTTSRGQAAVMLMNFCKNVK